MRRDQMSILLPYPFTTCDCDDVLPQPPGPGLARAPGAACAMVCSLPSAAHVDLSKPCDPMGYGRAAFWAAKKAREDCLLELFNVSACEAPILINVARTILMD